MAVELRCPDCRARLRLPEDPEPGTEIECPECNAVFQAPDPDAGVAPDPRGKKSAGAKGKKRPVEDGEDEPRKPAGEGKKGGGKKKAGKDPNAPRKRKAKKKETNKAALIAVIAVGVVFLSLVIGLLVWFFTRKPASYEMMNYLPDDATGAVGLNLGHMHKYAEFIKVVEPTYKNEGFQKAVEALAKPLGADPGELPDYVVQGWGKGGSAVVVRTKKEFDPDDLKKLPGARAGSVGGQTYYQLGPIPNLFGGTPVRVFAPTNRLVVFCSNSVPQPAFQRMANGNKDDPDKTLPARLGQLGKRTTRGTFWAIGVLDASNRPPPPPKQDGNMGGGGGEFQTELAAAAAAAKGFGFKASLGSRAIRFEAILWLQDSDKPSELAKKYKESTAKAQDDASADPPKWWKDFGTSVAGSKKVAGELFMNLGFKSSGELFIVSSECDTKLMMEVVPSLVSKITGQQSGGPPGMGGPGGGMGGMAPGGPPPGGAAPGPGLPGGVAAPGMMP